MKPVITEVSAKTDLKTQPLKEDTKQIAPINATADEKTTINYISQRYEAMKRKRAIVDKNWTIYQRQHEAVYQMYRDGRTRVNVPLEYASVESFVAEAINRKTIYDFDPIMKDDIQKAKAFRKVWDYDWNKENREEEVIKNEYTTAIFGTSALYNGYEMINSVIQDPTDVDEEGKLQFEPKLRKQGKLVLRNLDIRFVYVDDKATCNEDMEDCIYEEYLGKDQFENFKYDKNYFNLESVGTITVKEKVFYTTQEGMDSNIQMVKLRHYWNRIKDRYVVVANDNVVIRSHPILYAHKELPITIRQYSHNPFNIYGRGLCEILMSFKSEINTFKETIIDSIKRSNSETIAIGSGLTFEEEQFGYTNTVMRFNGQLAGNFQQLTGTPPNQAIFEYLKELYRDVATYTGIDIQSILGQPSRTAFEVAVQQESSLKRVNVVLKNRDMAFTRMAKLHASNIMQFYPIKIVRDLIPLKEMDGEMIPQTEGLKETYPTIGMKGEEFKGGRFSKRAGLNVFEIKPDAIRAQLDIQVQTNLNAPTLKQLERNNTIEFMNAVTQFSSAIQIDPALKEIIPVNEFIKDLAFKFNVDIPGLGQEDDEGIEEEKNELFDVMNNLNSAMTTGNMPMAQDQMQQTGALPPQAGQPGATANTPNIPNIAQL